MNVAYTAKCIHEMSDQQLMSLAVATLLKNLTNATTGNLVADEMALRLGVTFGPVDD